MELTEKEIIHKALVEYEENYYASESQRWQKIINKLIEESKASEDKIPDYKKGFNILMEYWDSLPDEEKDIINLKLKEVGL